MQGTGNHIVDMTPEKEVRILKRVFKYMTRKKLDHMGLMKEIENKTCGLATSIREYLIFRHMLGKRLVIDEAGANKQDEVRKAIAEANASK